ncbi:hypothetical protein F383_14698 [Gossypium arboreum]|uniref:Uncharacterized protein n=2 Tax=Gossypium arboreum TaxID=29729 RepID=A0A0B0PYP8_GOSAR|nr:hypothetical protein F383_14698 [Gossypium arboreum]
MTHITKQPSPLYMPYSSYQIHYTQYSFDSVIEYSDSFRSPS